MVVLTALGIGATLTIALLTLKANRTASAAQRVATEAHTEALDATRRASESQVATLDAIVERLNTQAEKTSSPTTDVRWRLERDIGPNSWLLRNHGTATAFNVDLQPLTDKGRWGLRVPFDLPRDVPPTQYVDFGTSGHSPLLLEATWSDEFDSQQSYAFVVAE